MWEEADLIDAETGGMDSIPEEEQYDYQVGCLIALQDDFKYGRDARMRAKPIIIEGAEE